MNKVAPVKRAGAGRESAEGGFSSCSVFIRTEQQRQRVYVAVGGAEGIGSVFPLLFLLLDGVMIRLLCPEQTAL